MRYAVLLVAALFGPPAVAAQSLSSVPQDAGDCLHSAHSAVDRLGFDPYNPTHLAIIRNYGGAVLSQAPVGALLKLDPYVPSEAALLRQVGGGMPFWAYVSYGGLLPADRPRPCATSNTATPAMVGGSSTAAQLANLQDVYALLQQRGRTDDGTPAIEAAASFATTRDNEPARGITIQYDGRVWTSAGHAVRLTESDFVRVGERAGLPIYMRSRGRGDNTPPAASKRPAGLDARDGGEIYVPTLPGIVAPFRVVR